MRVLIVENEVYLAQSICAKLQENGYTCEIVTNTRDALKNEKYDAVLLSTNISGQNFYPVIEKHRNSIILLMISYISSDTIVNPIKAGASDYIQKPFMIEELLRKLHHLRIHDRLSGENRMYSDYLEYIFRDIKPPKFITKKINAPLLIRSLIQTCTDVIVFNYAHDFGENFIFISLTDPGALDKISKSDFSALLYLVDLQNTRTPEREKLYKALENRRAIVASTNMREEFPFDVMDVDTSKNFLEKMTVLTLDDYVRNVAMHFQDKLPDTEIAKKLGISRKSLWERRKRHGFEKR